MSRTFHHNNNQIKVTGIRKDPPDLRRLARALIALAEAQAETEAEAQVKAETKDGVKGLSNRKKPKQDVRIPKATNETQINEDKTKENSEGQT
jgi:hypothetical protein